MCFEQVTETPNLDWLKQMEILLGHIITKIRRPAVKLIHSLNNIFGSSFQLLTVFLVLASFANRLSSPGGRGGPWQVYILFIFLLNLHLISPRRVMALTMLDLFG